MPILDVRTLTPEQKEMKKNGYNIYLNEDSKMVIEEPNPMNDFCKNKKIKEIEDIFKKALLPITSEYSVLDIQAFPTQLAEAEKFKATWNSSWIKKEKADNETEEEYADKIIEKALILEDIFTSAKKEKRKALKNLTS